ncbi:BTAD domain-containing putative transcriptional regulator [Thermomonospora cellulosilytica]|uniref:Putative ATPase/DNA-binding SARP family transcriptional activator n=1 Tax=Thermomonospora cellulosilytica TaxID=1411118 RepID=A0A7W3MYF1_9ACTN|nr:BTAD domain-containing putative transcriptional regulator [Thermomonospora cellulosilytica]MBA9004218.1 putative ATPase/DNA-binding SARP family transcriptional activator [Thermomonospora cellulosilytica]
MSEGGGIRVALLGPVRAYADGSPIGISGARVRLLLARLALARGRPVPSEVLIDDLWEADPLADATNALQALVSRLRKAVGAAAVELTGGGYRLRADVDAPRFEELAARGRRELAADRPAAAVASLDVALGLWTGVALSDLPDVSFVRTAVARLEELRLGAVEDRFEAALRLGRHGEVLADLEASARAHPLRERLAVLRMRALHAAGQQSAALAAYEEIRGALAEQLGVDPGAELRQVHLALLRGELDPPVTRPKLVPGRLPAQLTSFTGRDAELRLLAGQLATARLVTIVGPGGVGKTRLAIEAAARHPANEQGRVWFVPLAGVGAPAENDPSGRESAPNRMSTADRTNLAAPARPADLARTVDPARTADLTGAADLAGAADPARVAGPAGAADPVGAAGEVAGAVLGVLSAAQVRLTGGRQGVIDQLVELIGPEAAVLVLDNCEHLVAAAAEFAGLLLERLPRLTILATSREPLAITGEALCRLGPLELPTGVATADDSAAVRLFVDRARAVRPGFALDESTAGPVVDICRRLDGLPLALELAAARLRSMTVEQIAHRLDDRFRLLTSGSRTALPRHRTLLAVVEWSWELLTEQERVLAARLSIFPGGATAAALEAVCADGTLPADEVVYVLGSLVDKSLVQWDGRRYRMLETIRAYASERLDERKSIADRFLRYFLASAEEHEPRVRSREQLASMRWFDAEYDNLISALRTAINDGAADAAARLTGSLLWYWQTLRSDARAEGFVAEVLGFGDALPGHTRAALTALYRMPGKDGTPADPEQVCSVIEDCIGTGALDHHPMLLIMTAPMAYFVGRRELAERLLRAAEDHPDRWAAAVAAWLRAVFRNDQGDWTGAAAEWTRALRGFEAVGERLGLAFTLGRVAQNHAVQGEHEQALAALERCVTLAAEVGWEEEISYRARLGAQRLRAGDPDGARRALDAALRQAVERGRPHLRIEAMVGLADLHRRAGEPDRAEQMLDHLEALVRGQPGAEQTAAIHIAPVRMAIRIDTGATTAARELLPWVAGVGSALRDMAAPAAELLARLLAREGDAAGAATALGMSQVIRGTFDRGDPELRELIDDLTARLGATAYAQAFDRGAGMPRAEALGRLCSP